MVLESAMTRMVMKISLKLQGLSLSKQPKYQNALEKMFNDMEECDPMPECSLTCKHPTSTAFVAYAETLKRCEAKSQAHKAEAIF